MLYVRVYMERQAERLFRKARQGFVELEAPFELGLASLDLSTLLHRQDRWAELQELAADTFGRFRLLSADSGAIAALSMWMDAVRAKRLKEELVVAVKETLEERLWRQRPRRPERR